MKSSWFSLLVLHPPRKHTKIEISKLYSSTPNKTAKQWIHVPETSWESAITLIPHCEDTTTRGSNLFWDSKECMCWQWWGVIMVQLQWKIISWSINLDHCLVTRWSMASEVSALKQSLSLCQQDWRNRLRQLLVALVTSHKLCAEYRNHRHGGFFVCLFVFSTSRQKY